MSLDPTSWGWPFPATWAAFLVIVMLRANATYWAGRLVRRGVAGGPGQGRMAGRGYQRAAGWVDRWGAPVVTASFLTVGFQTLINLAAGASRMAQSRYLPAVVLGSVLWASIYSTLGFVGLAALTGLWQRSPAAAAGVLTALALLLVVFVLRQRGRSPQAAADRDLRVDGPARVDGPVPGKGSAQAGDE